MSVIPYEGRIWISSPKAKSMFALQKDYSMAECQFSYQEFGEGSIESKLLVDSNTLECKNFLFMCIQGDNIRFAKRKCNSPSEWNITSGMVVGDRFYLFGSKKVYIFDKNAFNNPEKEVTLTKTSLRAFFGLSSGRDQDLTSPSTLRGSTEAGMSHLIA